MSLPGPRASTGGKTPLNRLHTRERRLHNTAIKDHEENDVRLVWRENTTAGADSFDVPYPFPFQVYITKDAAELADDPGFPSTLSDYVESGGQICSGDCNYRLEVYAKAFSNILACVAHQREEVRYRNGNGIVPRLVPTWSSAVSDGHRGRIIVIDQIAWAKTGVVLVSFDPVQHTRLTGFHNWNTAGGGDSPFGGGDTDLVQAYRCRSRSILPKQLTNWRRFAGGTRIEADLARRNAGGLSPVLYPAVDPTAHYDVEHEDLPDMDGPPLPEDLAEIAIDDSVDGVPRIIETFDQGELFKSCHELACYRTEAYSDSFGLPVTSVWAQSHSKMRPLFSVALYLSFDMLPVQAKALFGCLNKGLIADQAWTLDVIYNMPSLDAAFEYHRRSTKRRTASRYIQTTRCMQMLLEKTAGSTLPSELLEHIEQILVPPAIANYSARPCRPFSDVFMYLDASQLSTGPLLAYSNPAPFAYAHNDMAMAMAIRAGFIAPDVPPGAHSKKPWHEEDVLKVAYLRYWHRVADEIHILWSLSVPRLVTQCTETPRVSVRIAMPRVCVWRPSLYDRGVGRSEVELTLHASEPITVHPNSLFSLSFWDEAVEPFDVETGRAIAMLPYKDNLGSYCDDSWSRSRELGYEDGAPWSNVLHPNQPTKSGPWIAPEENWWENDPARKFMFGDLIAPSGTDWWEPRVRRCMFVNGRKYALRLKPLTIPRWTWGTGENVKGPYNLPPIPVTLENEVQFTFRIEEGQPLALYST